MEKYELHGLTRAEDQVLGGFTKGEVGERLDTSQVEGANWEPGWPHPTKVIQSMARKGLLTIDGSTPEMAFRLTSKGAKLWTIRATEESGGAWFLA